MSELVKARSMKDVEEYIISKTDWTTHEIAEHTLVLNGFPLSLNDYKLMHPMYNRRIKKTVYKTARQVSKSTTLGNIMTINCFYRGFFDSLFIAPLEQHVYRFSNLVVKPLLIHSPIINQCTEKNAVRSVLVKSFDHNGSVMHFGYCQNGVDRIRGISVDEINWDEVQDLVYEHIPVVQECMSASDYKWQRYCGTPRTMENTLEYLWMKSSQNEPVVRCSRCNKDSIADDGHVFDFMSEEGPICHHCKQPLRIEDIINLRWEPQDPDRDDYFAGYHIPQILVVRNLTESNWRDIWEKYIDYPKYRFANEVLGISWDSGGRLITLSELKSFCTLEVKQSVDKKKYLNICAGVDWGISAVTSFTVVVVVGLRPDLKWELLFFYKFHETNPTYQIDTICKILRYWDVDVCGCDFGVGHANNDQLRRRWCNNNLHRVSEYNYVRSNYLVAWNGKVKRFSLNRTQSLNNLFFEMKDGKLLFPKAQKIGEVFDDILSEYEEVSEGPFGVNKLFRHPPEVPDDYLHAINFAIITSKRVARMLVVDYSYNHDDQVSSNA